MEILKILQSSEFEERLRALGAIPRPAGIDEFGAFVREEYSRWGATVRQSGAKVE